MAMNGAVSVLPEQSDEPPNITSAGDGDIRINEAPFRCFSFPHDLLLPLIRKQTETQTYKDDSITLPEYQSIVQVMNQLDHLWLCESVISIGSSKQHQQPQRKPDSSSNIVELTEPSQWSKSSSAPGNGLTSRGSASSDYIPPPRFSAIPSRKSSKPVKDRNSKMRLMNQKAAVQISMDSSPICATNNSDIDIRHDSEQNASNSASSLLTRRQVFSKTPADTLIVTLHSAKLHSFEAGDLEHSMKAFKRIDHGAGMDPAVNNGSTSHVNRCAQGDVPQFQPLQGNSKLQARMWRRTSSKSMTAIEFQELQGFMDLGFHFGKDEITPRLVTMLPALKETAITADQEQPAPRNNFTERPKALVLHRHASTSLSNWHMPPNNDGNNAVDMKEHIKFWARAVASTVRQEC